MFSGKIKGSRKGSKIMKNGNGKQAAVIDYPSHPEEPISESAKHFNLIVYLYEGLLELFRDRLSEVAIHANMSWYPTKKNTIWKSPDLLIAFGRPTRNDRISYAQVLEENVGPQVIFEMWSLGNSQAQIEEKRKWYGKYGVQEFYWINYDQDRVEVYLREGKQLVRQELPEKMWKSPLLGISLDWSKGPVQVLLPNGIPMPTREQIEQKNRELAERAEQEAQQKREALLRAKQLEAELNALRKRFGLDSE